MSDKYVNLNRIGPNTTAHNNLETKYDSEIDINPEGDQNGVSICHLFGSCLRKYGTLLLALQTDALCSAHLTISLVTDIKDEFSRLRIWGEQTYAVLPQNSRRSLDEQLREDGDTRTVVIRCLQRLDNHIEKGWFRHHIKPHSCD